MLNDELTVEMNVKREELFALKISGKITIDVPTVLVLTNGEILVQHEECDSCRPKTTGLSELGTQITLAKGITYRVRNNTLKRAAYLVIYPEVSRQKI